MDLDIPYDSSLSEKIICSCLMIDRNFAMEEIRKQGVTAEMFHTQNYKAVFQTLIEKELNEVNTETISYLISKAQARSSSVYQLTDDDFRDISSQAFTINDIVSHIPLLKKMYAYRSVKGILVKMEMMYEKQGDLFDIVSVLKEYINLVESIDGATAIKCKQIKIGSLIVMNRELLALAKRGIKDVEITSNGTGNVTLVYEDYVNTEIAT